MQLERMVNMVDLGVLGAVAFVAFVMAKIFEAIKDRMGWRWETLSDTGKEIGGYVFAVITGLVLFASGLDMFPAFNAYVPWLGRLVTCLAGAWGPGVVFDIGIDQPKPLEVDVVELPE